MCPAETPEGHGVLCVKTLLLPPATISNYSNPASTYMYGIGYLNVQRLSEITPIEIYSKTKIFVHGHWYGIHSDPNKIVKHIRSQRRMGMIHPYGSISWRIDSNRIEIWTDAGRMLQPLYIYH